MKMTSDLRNALRIRAYQEIYRPKRPEVIIEPPAANLFDYAASRIGAERPIFYLEFGVAHGKSIKYNAELFTHAESRFIGFDSFAGLPEDWLYRKRGDFHNHGRPPVTRDPRIAFVTGWFQNSVPGALAALEIPETHQVLIHFDSDLYSSTLFLLTQIWGKIPDYMFIFNDFMHDEVVALSDFLSAYPVSLEYYAQTRGGGDPPYPTQAYGRMRRIVFELPE